MLRTPLHDGPGAPQLLWHGTQAHVPDWSGTSRVLAWQRMGVSGSKPDSVYVAMNMHWENLDFEPPNPPAAMDWHIVVNTAMPSPDDICEPGKEPRLGARTATCGRSFGGIADRQMSRRSR